LFFFVILEKFTAEFPELQIAQSIFTRRKPRGGTLPHAVQRTDSVSPQHPGFYVKRRNYALGVCRIRKHELY
jgi:hypothetical protein